MILLDTNALSELMRPAVTAKVAAWGRTQPPDELSTTSLGEAEIRYGIARLPPGHRRERLETAFGTLLAQGFTGRVLAFDSDCAAGYATVRVRREAVGRPIS